MVYIYNLAHRGMSGLGPENTRIAFKDAVHFGFDGVELDVQLSKDGKVVINHDEKINRTTNGRGYIKNMTLKQLKTYNFANNYRGAKSQEILTLKEFLKEFADKFKIINIELKTDVEDYEGIEKKVLKIIEGYDSSKFILSSFNFQTLRNIRKINKEINVGFLWKSQKAFKLIESEEILKVCNYLHPSIALFKNQVYLTKYKTLNLPFIVWTVKSKITYKRLAKNKHVHSVISNHLYKKRV